MKPKVEVKKKSRSGTATGTSNDERRARGLERIAGIWLEAELIDELDAVIVRDKTSRTTELREALRAHLKKRR